MNNINMLSLLSTEFIINYRIYKCEANSFFLKIYYLFAWCTNQILLEGLPVELVGTNVLSFLSLQSMIMLERACASKESHQAFMEQIPHCTPCELPDNKIPTLLTLQWFAKRKCRLLAVDIILTADNPVFDVTNLMVDNFLLLLDSDTTTESL